MKPLIKKAANIALRVVILIMLVVGFAVIGSIVVTMMAGIYEVISGQPFVINGRHNYESAVPIGFVAGTLFGLIISWIHLFGSRSKW